MVGSRAEGSGNNLRRHWGLRMAKSQIPFRFWNDQPGQGIGSSEVRKKSREDDKGLGKKAKRDVSDILT